MFRGKESSNRIELSRLVQDLLNFGVLESLRLWEWGVVGGAPRTCTHTHAHVHVLNMIIICKWPPPLGESLGILYDVIRTCVCTCVGHPLTTPYPHPPTPTPLWGPPESMGGVRSKDKKFNKS